MDSIFDTSNAEYFDLFPGLPVSDSAGILGGGLVRSGVAPVGTSDVLNPSIWTRGGLLDLASQDPLGASFLASQQQLANQYLFGGGLEQDLVFPNQVLDLLQGGGDPNLSFGANYLQSLGFDSWVEPSYFTGGAEAFSYVHYLPNGDAYSGIGYVPTGTYAEGQILTGYTYGDGSSSTYQIVDVVGGYDGSLIGIIDALHYYDVETNSYANVQSYTGYFGLGSESGYAYNADYSNNDGFFGYGYEGDLTGVPSYQADLYYFAYYYPNGDAYSGYGYAPTGTFTPGQTLTGYTHEDGYVGTYQIGDVFSGYDISLANQVEVSHYYDAETASYTYVQSYTGYFGIGSESGYAYLFDFVDESNFFGYGYEAEVV